MNARLLLNFRVSTPGQLSGWCRLLAVSCLIAAFSVAGCSAKPTTTGTDDAIDQDSTDNDGSITDQDGLSDDGTTQDTTDQADGKTDLDVPKDTSDTTNPDGGDIGTDAVTGDADAGKPDTGPIPPICPEAKGSCALCTLCPAFPICTLKEIGKPDLKTYPNDCAAMCALNAYNWPQEVGTKVWPTECPACSLCTPADMKTTNDQYCVFLKSGASLTVDHACEVGCVADAAMKADGVTPNATKGACKAKCTAPTGSGGGGCSTAKGQPICAKEDNSTYWSQCKMENCDICLPDGATAKTSQCVKNSMTKECDGACYDQTKTPNCTSQCDPVCGIKKVKLANQTTLAVGTSYRTSCIAAADGASVGDCTGISNTPSDVCAAASLYKSKGCCPDVEYSIIHPVCGSQAVAGKPDVFVTFQNQGEYDCLTKADTSWTFQYSDACKGSCTDNYQPVCGADGFTYQNACQADYYNPPKGTFTYTTGPCSP